MADITIQPAADCRYDAVTLGEVMLRIDPGDVPFRRGRGALTRKLSCLEPDELGSLEFTASGWLEDIERKQE